MALIVIGCTTPDTPVSPVVGLVVRDLRGDWKLLGWQQYQAGGSATANLMENGATGQLSISLVGNFRFEFDAPGAPARVDSGVVVVTNDVLLWEGELVEANYRVTLRNGALTLRAIDPILSSSPVPGGLRGSVFDVLQFGFLTPGS